MITLYDLLKIAKYDQRYHIYLNNDWDRNTFVGRGTREELLAQEYLASKDENMVFDYLQNEVDRLYSINNVVVVFVNDEEHNKPVEEIWNDTIVEFNEKLPIESKKFLDSNQIDYLAWKLSDGGNDK